MTLSRAALVAAVTAVAAILVWLLFVGLPSWYGRRPAAAPPVAGATASAPQRKINARLFYVADDGTSLVSLEREVAYAEDPVEQAKAIVAAQIEPVADPLVSAIPPGTSLRALFVTKSGEAYVDFSRELLAAHPGGSMNEMLTIYTLVDVLTVNLPAIGSVQILVDGKEVDTLAGHVDLRRPLLKKVQ
jgi:spore germination protein GerM